MYKVVSPFRDKYNNNVYRVGESFNSDSSARIENLLKRKLIEGVSNDAPSINAANKNELQLMTKKELMKELTKSGIEFSNRQNKDELITLLLGGD